MGQLPSEAPGEAPSFSPNLVEMMSTNAVRSMSHKKDTIKDWLTHPTHIQMFYAKHPMNG